MARKGADLPGHKYLKKVKTKTGKMHYVYQNPKGRQPGKPDEPTKDRTAPPEQETVRPPVPVAMPRATTNYMHLTHDAPAGIQSWFKGGMPNGVHAALMGSGFVKQIVTADTIAALGASTSDDKGTRWAATWIPRTGTMAISNACTEQDLPKCRLMTGLALAEFTQQNDGVKKYQPGAALWQSEAQKLREAGATGSDTMLWANAFATATSPTPPDNAPGKDFMAHLLGDLQRLYPDYKPPVEHYDVPKIQISKCSAEDYVAERDKADMHTKNFLTLHSAEELKKDNTQTFMVKLGKGACGYTLGKDGYMGGFFNTTGIHGLGQNCLIQGIAAGAKTGDCIGEGLAAYYSKFGLTEDHRDKWNPKYAPEHWEDDPLIKGTTPDIIYVKFTGPTRDPDQIRENFTQEHADLPKPATSLAKLSPEEKEAINNTQGAQLTPAGLTLEITRNQKPEQAGEMSLRSGVFYSPERKSPYQKYYTTGRRGYGGQMRIEGKTTFRNPVIVKASGGGKAPERAYDSIMGKGAYEKMRKDVLGLITYSRGVAVDDIQKLLARYGEPVTPYVAETIYNNSKEGNQLPYALQERIVAGAIRKAKRDAVIGYTKLGGKMRLSEVFDVRAATYPAQEHEQKDYPDFYRDYQAA